MGRRKPRQRQRDLLAAIYANEPTLVDQVRGFLAAGVDPSRVTEYAESPLRVASNQGRFDVVRVLLDGGADGGQLEWTPTFHAVAFGDLNAIRTSASTTTWPCFGRTVGSRPTCTRRRCSRRPTSTPRPGSVDRF